jgi:acyl-[acyl-carrier-protein]-phospholipid O-acyltransferase/long-chain-fatty-acid--[acyl-carrier-protein] ligase
VAKTPQGRGDLHPQPSTTRALSRAILNASTRLSCRISAVGLEHLDAAGPGALLVVHHANRRDAAALASLLPAESLFVVDWADAKQPWARPFLRGARCHPVQTADGMAPRALARKAAQGERLVLFCGGDLASAERARAYKLAAMIALKADAPVVHARIERKAASFGRHDLRVIFTPARKLAPPASLRGRARTAAGAAAIYDMVSDLAFARSDLDRTLFEAFTQATKALPRGHAFVEDPLTGALGAGKARIGAALLGRKIMALTEEGERVGLMLPNAVGAAVVFFALQAAGRTPAMLNFSAGSANVLGACRAAQLRIVLTSRAFIEKGKLSALIEAMEPHVRLVYLEDVRAGITLGDKLRAITEAGKPLARRAPDDPAVILFTSGSEGAPKGVALSHRNLLANVAQIHARADLTTQDIVFNALPVFHSFGLTAGLLLPALSGMKCFLYPSPLHYQQIPELVCAAKATVMFGTDTFLNGYARAAQDHHFKTVRYLVAGAEAVKDATRRMYRERFGVDILEGYGVTETAPVVSANTPIVNRPGTVGRLVAGVETRLDPVPGIHGAGRLFVRGPNVMLGYYRAEAPGVLEPPAGGWHDTGDIVAIDEEGFLAIRGRAKRFAKIAGEMVSLAAVETMCAGLWDDEPLAVMSAPDPRKGERLILLTARPDATRADAMTHLRKMGATELMIPAEVIVLPEFPVLASGKTDLVALDQMVRTRASA